MRKLITLVAAVVMFFGVLGMARMASAIPYTDTFDPEPDIYLTAMWNWEEEVWEPGYPVNWTFDITDDGFDPATQDVTGAVVTLYLSDDANDPYLFQEEYAQLDIGPNSYTWEVNTGEYTYTVESLMTLNEFGTIDCTLIALEGDFIFGLARLDVEGTEPVNPSHTPEPCTMLLLGSGIAGIGLYRRKRIGK